MQLAERMNRIGVESAFDVLVQARELERSGRSIMHLEIGEPDFETPRHIVDAAKQALNDGWTHYGPAQGYMDLREAIAADAGRTRGFQVGPENICVVPGGKPIIFFTMLALLEPGDEVVYPNPGFPIYESVIRFLGATPVPMPLEEKRGFSFDIDLLKSKLSRRTKLLVLNSPQNPTGAIIGYQDMRAIAETVWNHDLCPAGFMQACRKLTVNFIREHHQTAAALHLDGGKLKRRMSAADSRPRKAAPPAFVELMASATDGSPEYTIELEGRHGKLRIHSKGATAADVAELSRALWGLAA